MMGITDQTYYRWRKEYGGLRTDQGKRLQQLGKKDARLKRLLADAELDRAILGRPRRETFEIGEVTSGCLSCT